ncbi:hypothetical protein D3C85_1589560 [compost metagenome]
MHAIEYQCVASDREGDHGCKSDEQLLREADIVEVHRASLSAHSGVGEQTSPPGYRSGSVWAQGTPSEGLARDGTSVR